MDNRTVKYLISRIKEHSTMLENLINAKRSTNNISVRYKLSSRIGHLNEKRNYYLKLLRHKGEGTLVQVRYTSFNDKSSEGTKEKTLSFVNISKDDARDLIQFWGDLSESTLEILEIKEIEIKV